MAWLEEFVRLRYLELESRLVSLKSEAETKSLLLLLYSWDGSGNTKGESITAQLTSCGLYYKNILAIVSDDGK